MMITLVIRPSPLIGQALVDALRAQGAMLSDVFDSAQIDIRFVGTDGDPQILFAGRALRTFGHIVFLGLPAADSPNGRADTEDACFRRDEWDAAIVAALARVSPALVNAGEVFCLNRMLFRPSRFLPDLARLGWDIPKLKVVLDREQGRITRALDPDTSCGTRYLLALTPDGHVLMPLGDVVFPQCPDFDARLSRTRAYLCKLGLDWAFIPLLATAERVYACGLGTEVPSGIDIGRFAALLAQRLS